MLNKVTKENKKLLKDLGSKIKKLRDDLKMSQEEFAFMANIDRTYISSIEKGERNISIITFIKIAEAFGNKIDLAELLNKNG